MRSLWAPTIVCGLIWAAQASPAHASPTGIELMLAGEPKSPMDYRSSQLISAVYVGGVKEPVQPFEDGHYRNILYGHEFGVEETLGGPLEAGSVVKVKMIGSFLEGQPGLLAVEPATHASYAAAGYYRVADHWTCDFSGSLVASNGRAITLSSAGTLESVAPPIRISDVLARGEGIVLDDEPSGSGRSMWERVAEQVLMRESRDLSSRPEPRGPTQAFSEAGARVRNRIAEERRSEVPEPQ